MSEHRTPEVRTIISELEKKIKEQDRKAYVDPVKAEEAKEKGNEFFNKGNYFKVIWYVKGSVIITQKYNIYRFLPEKIGLCLDTF